MGIFKELAEMLSDGQQLNITLRKADNDLVASIMPSTSGVKDKAVENISPICLSGSPEDFDEGFVAALKEGLPKATGLVDNIKEYEESVENARKATEMAKKAKDEKDKAKKEFDGYIELARINLKEEKFVDAKKCLDKAAAVKDADKSLIEKARKAVDERSGAGSIFGGPLDKSDGKNITLNKDFKVPTPAAKEEPKTEEPKNETNNAFEEAMNLSDEGDTENENEE